MALKYKIEYILPSGPSDDSVYIHIKEDECDSHQERIGKEDYCDSTDKKTLIDSLFEVEGVVEVSVKAYRVWIMKSPIYNWEEIILPVLYVLRDHFGETSISPLPGSAEIDGSGLRIPSENDRRAI